MGWQRRGSGRRSRWRKRPHPQRWEAAGLLVLAAALGLFAYRTWHDLHLLTERGVTATGTVEDVSWGRDSSIVVRFTTPTGLVVEEETSNFIGDYVEGDRVEVLYDPVDPYRMQAADWGTDYVDPVLLGSGAAIALAGAGLAAAGRLPVRDDDLE